MEWLSESPDDNYFNVSLKQVIDTRKAYGFDTEESINQAVDIFQSWVEKQEHFVNKKFERKYLEALIIRAKGSLEKAKKRLDKLCTLKTHMPEVFGNIDIEKEGDIFIKFVKSVAMKTVLPDNYTLVLLKMYNLDNFSTGSPSLTLMNLIRLAVVTSEYCMVKDYSIGYEVIVDMTYVPSLSRLIPLCNPVMLQKMITILMDGYGVRMKNIHMISSSKVISTLVGLLKQGLGEKMGNRIKVHVDYASLQQNIPKEYLPKDLGGERESLDKLQGDFFDAMKSEEHKRRMKQAVTWGTDESKRFSDKFNEEYLGMPGTFRTLVVD